MKRKRDDTFDDVQTIIKRIKLFIDKKRKREKDEDDDELASSCKRLKIDNNSMNNNSIYSQWRRDILIYT